MYIIILEKTKARFKIEFLGMPPHSNNTPALHYDELVASVIVSVLQNNHYS